MTTTETAGPPVTVFRRPLPIPADALLRTVLKIDAMVTGVNALAYLAAADVLDGALGISGALLRSAGAALLAFAAAVYYTATRRPVRPAAVRGIVAVNAVWVVDSLVALLASWLTPTTAGTLWVTAQAAVVAGFAAVQHRALAATRPAATKRST